MDSRAAVSYTHLDVYKRQVVTYFCATQDPVHQISIIPRGMAGGYTMQLPTEDRSYRSRKEMKEELVVLLGGRVAESLALDDISTGASNDIERATKQARSMVTKYGMTETLGPVSYTHLGYGFRPRRRPGCRQAKGRYI